MCDAVDKYKSLTEGGYAGKIVSHVQHVSGIDFFYQPPPRSKMPQAASLKGNAKYVDDDDDDIIFDFLFYGHR